MAEIKKKSVFETLSAIDVSGKIEKKNGLSYVSWAWAWYFAKREYPDAFFTVYENEEGLNYHTDGRTCWVKTGVTIEGIELIEYLPVMDNRNASIPAQKVTSTDINKSIQRSLTKALARHGLGLCVYAGEDLPLESDDETRAQVNAAIETARKKPAPAPVEAPAENLFPGFDQDLEVALSDLKAAKSRKEILELDKRYRGVYGQYAKAPSQRYMDALAAACRKYPRESNTK